ncbi:CD151 antigen [Eumeta japonica]|uniref:Tetraspanin n=1 Tax=Eumeta variegata TaxID=151549 RepID=A0A4C1ZZZ4_EUMVA|nr:CD151 antigen [Eumeta japonica]
MGLGGVFRAGLAVASAVYAVLGLALVTVGVWFFVNLYDITSLRNSNHYLLDYRVYWPQVAPWLFIIVGLFMVGVAVLGWVAARRQRRGLVAVCGALLLVAAVGHALATALVLVFVDDDATDKFIKDTIYDGYYNSQSEHNALMAFGRIEQRLRCCGANDARDYRSWRNDLPGSCCGHRYFGATCDFTDKEANERLGCTRVATVYARIISRYVGVGDAVIAALLLAGAALAWRYYVYLDERDHEHVVSNGKGETDC